jgi:hypothetical protein
LFEIFILEGSARANQERTCRLGSRIADQQFWTV